MHDSMEQTKDFASWQEKEIKRLKKVLERISNSIVVDGNSIGMTISIPELKGIVETALDE